MASEIISGATYLRVTQIIVMKTISEKAPSLALGTPNPDSASDLKSGNPPG